MENNLPLMNNPPEPPLAPMEEMSVCQYAAEIFKKNIGAIQLEIDGVRKDEDIEYLHRMRVASRRIRTGMEVFSECLPAKKKNEWRNQVKQATQALGETRDTDVQILMLQHIYENLPEPAFRTGMRRLILRSQQKRAKLQKKVLATLDTLLKRQVLEQIEKRFANFKLEKNTQYSYPQQLYKMSFEIISKRLDEFLAYEVYLERPEFVKELHTMRIEAKRLRYAMEIFAPIFPDHLAIPLRSIRQTQEILGEIHDCDVWLIELPDFLEKERIRIQHYIGHTRSVKLLLPGITFFEENRRNERRKLFSHFQKTWKKWHKEETWMNLKKSLLTAMVPPIEQTEQEQDDLFVNNS